MNTLEDKEKYESKYADKLNYTRRFHTGGVGWKELKAHPFLFLQEHKRNYKGYAEVAVKGIECPNLLSQTFFSDGNLKIVQYRLKKFVYWETWKQTGTHYVIQPQDETKLVAVMRYVYETYGKFLPFKIKEQVDELDDWVVKEAGPDLVAEVLCHVGYLKHINNPIEPIDRPRNLSSKGTKLLPSVTTIFHENNF